MIVPSSCPLLVEEAAQIAVPASSSLLPVPLMDGVNHHLGVTMGGLLHCAQWPTTGREGTGRFYVYRHPNSVALMAWAMIVDVSGEAPSFTAQAGTGTTRSYTPVGAQAMFMTLPWGVGDSGWVEVVYAADDCHLGGISVWGLQRPTLTTADGDLVAERYDADHVLAGLEAEHAIIADDADENFCGILDSLADAATYGTRQAVSWVSLGNDPSNQSTSYNNPLAPLQFVHRARRLGTETTRAYRVYARTYAQGMGGGDTYEWRVSASSGDSVTKTGLTRAVAGWDYVDGLDIDATADDTLTFGFKRVGSVFTMFLSDLTIAEVPA